LHRRIQDVDIVRVQEVGLRPADDPAILEWAASQGRVLITKDIKTVPSYAFQRISAREAMPGVFVLHSTVSMATASRSWPSSPPPPTPTSGSIESPTSRSDESAGSRPLRPGQPLNPADGRTRRHLHPGPRPVPRTRARRRGGDV
jgi:hypothetical protein